MKSSSDVRIQFSRILNDRRGEMGGGRGGKMFRLTWKNSLAQPPSWVQGRCRWWSATLCGAAASRWEWNPLWAAAAASPAGPEGRRGRRRVCRTGHGAQQSKNTTERERFTGEKQVKENRMVDGNKVQITGQVLAKRRREWICVTERIFPSLSFCWGQCCTTKPDPLATRASSRKWCQWTLSELCNSREIKNCTIVFYGVEHVILIRWFLSSPRDKTPAGTA